MNLAAVKQKKRNCKDVLKSLSASFSRLSSLQPTDLHRKAQRKPNRDF